MKRVVRPRGIILAAVLLLVVWAFIGSAGASSDQGDSEWRADPEEARLISETTGLTFGEAMRLIALSPHVDELRNRLEAQHPNRLAGVWLDVRDHGRVKVAFTKDGGIPGDARSGFPHPEVVDTELVPQALLELERLQERVSEESGELRDRGLDVVSVAIDVPRNTILVGATNPIAVRSELEKRHPGARIEVIHEEQPRTAACFNRRSCTPWRGGIDLYDPQSGSACSSAFAITATSSTSGLTHEGLLTAGHCFASDNRAIFHDLNVVGTSEPDRDQYAGSVDGAVILRDVGILDPADIAARLFKNVDQMWWPIYSDAGLSSGGVGSPICHSGVTRGHQCGTITLESVDFFSGWTRFTDFRENNICTLPGDSGGAVFHENVAHGIINFSNFEGGQSNPACASAPRTKYTQIYYAKRDLPMQIQHTP